MRAQRKSLKTANGLRSSVWWAAIGDVGEPMISILAEATPRTLAEISWMPRSLLAVPRSPGYPIGITGACREMGLRSRSLMVVGWAGLARQIVL